MERFIVGSGRCGSTLLNNMLALHPDVLMLSEFFAALDRTECFSGQLVTGEHFAALLGRSVVIADIFLRRGMREKEILTNTRDLVTLPGLLVGMVPSLSRTPDVLFRDLLEVAAGFPEQKLSQHYSELFCWLKKTTQKRHWVERSGPSLEFLSELIDMYPNALFVHLHRDGPESALSMQQHKYFQLVVSFFFSPPTRAEIESTEYAGCTVTSDDPFTQRLTNRLPPVEKFGEYWSYQQALGFRAFARLSSSQCLHIKFEDLVARPRAIMEQVSDFLQLPKQSAWVVESAKMPKGMPPTRLGTLGLDEQAALVKACRPGQWLLGREESTWIKPTLNLIKEISEETVRKGRGI